MMTDNKLPRIGTKWSIVPDTHACSFNRVKEIEIVQDGKTIILDQFDIYEIVNMLEDDD